VEFQEISEDLKVHPGEYILHKPSQQIVLVGAFKKKEGLIKVLARGKLIEDKIENFNKIKLSSKERKAKRISHCKGCGG
jgi:hypothetical protein|tara:strand:- start:716 stop:952 length:237 start_codon:yes stop_codon:yes gene_type:complete